MSITLDQIILDAQRIANRVKDLEALGNALLVEAEGNNRQIETIKQFQGDIDSLNKLTRDKSNSEMVNDVNLQNSNIRQLRQKNRELASTIEDQQRGLELIMHKYRQQIQHKIFTSRINFKEVYNAKLQDIIHKQQEKINEMAAIMQKAASIDDDVINNEIELIQRLKIENQGLREMLQISHQIASNRIGCEDKSINTENGNNNGNDGDGDAATILETTSVMQTNTMKPKTPTTAKLNNNSNKNSLENISIENEDETVIEKSDLTEKKRKYTIKKSNKLSSLITARLAKDVQTIVTTTSSSSSSTSSFVTSQCNTKALNDIENESKKSSTTLGSSITSTTTSSPSSATITGTAVPQVANNIENHTSEDQVS